MKKSLVALAALAAVGVASAQSTTTISGQFRLGLKSDANGTNTITPDQASGNVMNFDVVEDLGSGLSFVANAQLRFDASNGAFVNASGPANNGGTANSGVAGFHRVRVGLKSKDLGQILFGRIIFDQLHQYNAFGTTGASLTTVGAAAGSTENGQFQYTSPKLYGFNVVLGGSMKGNNTNATTTSGGKQFLVNYANGPFAASYVQETNRTAVHAKGIGASYDFGVAKVFATKYQDKSAAGAKLVDRWTVSAQAPIGPFVARVGYLRDSRNQAERGVGVARANKNSLGLDYALSKRTTVEAQTYKTKGDRERSLYLGLKHTY